MPVGRSSAAALVWAEAAPPLDRGSEASTARGASCSGASSRARTLSLGGYRGADELGTGSPETAGAAAQKCAQPLACLKNLGLGQRKFACRDDRPYGPALGTRILASPVGTGRRPAFVADTLTER